MARRIVQMNTLIGLAVIKMSIAKYLLAIVIAIVPIPNVEAFDENGEIFCLAKNIYFEAGNQPVAGKVAVSLAVSYTHLRAHET